MVSVTNAQCIYHVISNRLLVAINTNNTGYYGIICFKPEHKIEFFYKLNYKFLSNQKFRNRKERELMNIFTVEFVTAKNK